MVFVKVNQRSLGIDIDDLRSKLDKSIGAVFIENPSFLGCIETRGEEIGKLAVDAGAQFIVHVDPLLMGVMEPPPKYGANIVTGDLHPLGIHMNAGGGQAGFIGMPDDENYVWRSKEIMFTICKTKKDGEYGFSNANYHNTLFGSREKGNEYTGTVCGLWGICAGVYLALMGPSGMREIAETIMKRAQYAAGKISDIQGYSLYAPEAVYFKEFIVDCAGTGLSVKEINDKLLERGFIGGFDLGQELAAYQGCMLLCVTEVHTKQMIDNLASALHDIAEEGRNRG
jgi:glycine dehydrogenase subunit 1